MINVDLAPDPETHIHRIGRTGRAGRDGWALSLHEASERRKLAAITEAMQSTAELHALAELPAADATPLVAPMVTLLILGGRKDKIRPGDVMGALAAEAGLSREQVGKITVTDQNTYVAVLRSVYREALRKLSAGKLKGRAVKVRAL